jgi:hypothetical protein
MIWGAFQLVRVERQETADKESRKQLGRMGQLALAWKVNRRWGFRGLRRILRSERVFSSEQLGYGIVVGTRR